MKNLSIPLLALLLSIAAVLASSGRVRPHRQAKDICQEVKRELELYEPVTDTLNSRQVQNIVNRCYRIYSK